MRILVSKFLPFIIACMILSACTTAKKIVSGNTQQSVQATKTESGIQAGVNDPLDPLAQHLAARRQVNPNSSSSNEIYTKKADPQHPIPEPMPFRVLKLDSQMAELNKGKEVNSESFDPALAGAPRQKDGVIAYAPYSSLAGGEVPVRTPPEAKAKIVNVPSNIPSPRAGDVAVMGIRVGTHPGKTRIVLDVTQTAKFVANVDNAQKVLVVEIPGASIATESQSRLQNPLVGGYMAQTTDKGLALAIALKNPAKLVLSTVLKGGPHGNRIVLDLAPL